VPDGKRIFSMTSFSISLLDSLCSSPINLNAVSPAFFSFFFVPSLIFYPTDTILFSIFPNCSYPILFTFPICSYPVFYFFQLFLSNFIFFPHLFLSCFLFSLTFPIQFYLFSPSVPIIFLFFPTVPNLISIFPIYSYPDF
jgi:hypothetical protein